MQISPEVQAKYPKLSEFKDHFAKKENQAFWDDALVGNLSMVAASPNKLTWKFEVNEIHCNQLGNLHGGCVATLIDICSSFAIFVAEGKTWNLAGVSTDLSVSYLRGVPEGETITLVCEVARVGKALANIHTKVYDNENRLCYAGTHTKFNIDSRM